MKVISFIFLIMTHSLLANSVFSSEFKSQNKTFLSKLKQASKNISVGYFMSLNGPTLGGRASNETYNRFNSGFDINGNENDPTAPLGMFHSLSLSYKFKNGVSIGSGYVFDTKLNKDTTYTYKNFRGETVRAKSSTEVGRYNARINFFIPSIYNSRRFSVSSAANIELPTTQNAKFNEMKYGLILAPTVVVKTKNPKVYTGVNFNLQRNFYQENERNGIKLQTLLLSTGPFFNYSLAEKWTLKTSMNFDWDQRGDEVGSSKLNKNMDDIVEAGIKYKFNRHFNTTVMLLSPINKIEAEFITSYLNISLSI